MPDVGIRGHDHDKQQRWLQPSIPIACATLVIATCLSLQPASVAAAQQRAPEQASEQAREQASEKPKRVRAKSNASFINDVCRRIKSAAQSWKLPPAYFARLIWRESRFDPNAISPVGASGIAQFMPGTAKERNLSDPFDPRAAIPASAHFLSDLRDQFGNLGLAAAAYNAGPNRVQRWRQGQTGLPRETQNFVSAITGVHPRDWTSKPTPKPDYSLNTKLSFLAACRQLPVRRSKPRRRFAAAPWQPWGAHLTADWSPSKALSHYATLQRKYPGLLAGRTPMILRVVNYSFGRAPQFEVRIGQPNRKKAQKFCQRISNAGGACLVIKNQRQ